MTKQTISIGTSPNDHTGDPLRSAFTKINSNFTELYTSSTQPIIYTPTSSTHWAQPAPTTMQEALDRIALAIKALNSIGA